MKKLIFFTIIFFIAFSTKLKAQTSSLEIIDLITFENPIINDTLIIDSVDIHIEIKINKKHMAKKIHLSIGQ